MCRQHLTLQNANLARGNLALHQCAERSHLHLPKLPLRGSLITQSSHPHLDAPQRPMQRLQGLHTAQTAKAQLLPAAGLQRRVKVVSSLAQHVPPHDASAL